MIFGFVVGMISFDFVCFLQMRRIFLANGGENFDEDGSVVFLKKVVVAFLEVVPIRDLYHSGGGERGKKSRNLFSYVMRMLDFDIRDLDEAFERLDGDEVEKGELLKVFEVEGYFFS